jgi:predicted dehydrogenase
MSIIKWGIIGCGDVTEVKSGPAFQKVEGSELIAVMRRDAAKAEDYAKRHKVPKWYTDANDLINDPEINAVYVATPPNFHEEYTLAALKAGKPVYVEKPMAMNAASAIQMAAASKEYDSKLVVAHYRRALPLFIKIKELIDTKAVGEIQLANLQMLRSHKPDTDAKDEVNWRVNPEISGGGLFHDLAPHQIDLMLFFFGKAKSYQGFSANQAGLYSADDVVIGQIVFENKVLFNGIWGFAVSPESETEFVEIIGSKGKILFSVFGPYYTVTTAGKEERFEVPPPPHIQQPMIEQVVNYFLGNGENPCSAAVGIKVMQMIDSFCTKA